MGYSTVRHSLPDRPPHCAVCGTERDLVYLCPEHGARCAAHVASHAFCGHPKTVLRPGCDGTCAGNELGDCNHEASNAGRYVQMSCEECHGTGVYPTGAFVGNAEDPPREIVVECPDCGGTGWWALLENRANQP